MAIRKLCRIFKLHSVNKSGLVIPRSHVSDQKNQKGNDKLLTDDLILGDETDITPAISSGLNKDAPKKAEKVALTLATSLGQQIEEKKIAFTELPDNSHKDLSNISDTSVQLDTNRSSLNEAATTSKNRNEEGVATIKMIDPLNNINTHISQEAVTSKPINRCTTLHLGEEVDVLPSPISLAKLRKCVKPPTIEGNMSTTSFTRSVSSDTTKDVDKKPYKELPPDGIFESESETKKPLSDFNPNFEQTPDRKLNIGRKIPGDQDKEKKEANSQHSLFLEKNNSDNFLSKLSGQVILKKSAVDNFSGINSDKKVMLSEIAKDEIPDLISPQNYHEMTNKSYGFNTVESILNVKNVIHKQEDCLKATAKEGRIGLKPFPIGSLDPLSIPGYKPSLSEKPILPKDFIKFTEPISITSYDLVPGPTVLRTVGNIWKYVPILGTQMVATFIYSIQSLISSYDRKMKYAHMYPYYYLMKKYGPMVRLHGPIGADILVLAVNGQDFPLIHIKNRRNKSQSVFDSLNVYRKDAPPLSHLMNEPKVENKIPSNTSLQLSHYYSSLEKITDDFLRLKNFTKGYTGVKQNENHENYLIQWALQCTLDVYFKTKRNCLEPMDDELKFIDAFIKATKSLRLCETGIQLWRAFITLSWMDLTENCKYVDKFVADEISECLKHVDDEKGSYSVLELLLASGELKSNDLLTPLLDLLILNVNQAASVAGFLLYNLSKAPQVQRNLFTEISRVLPKEGNINMEDLANLKYLNSCIMETLRVVPPIPVLNRVLDEDTKIHGFQIPKGTFIQMVNVLPCNKGDSSSEDIGRFQAERWMDKMSVFNGDPFAGLPKWNTFPQFNKAILVTQVALLVAKVVREHRLDYPSNEIFADGMVLQAPSSPFNFGFTRRII